MLIGCWRFTGTPIQNRVGTVDNNATTPSGPEFLLGEFTKGSEGRINVILFIASATQATIKTAN